MTIANGQNPDLDWLKCHTPLLVTTALIESAMKSISAKTRVRFVPRTNQVDYLSIENLLGCWSTVGRSGGKQQVSLSVDGCVSKGLIQHELIHSLGFHHEHTRSDRDQYVQINWENIPQGSAYNFEKKDTNNLNTPYDYNSIMHYGRTAYAIQYGKETITPIPNPSVQIGQRLDMSNIDVQKINKLYECGEHITRSILDSNYDLFTCSSLNETLKTNPQ